MSIADARTLTIVIPAYNEAGTIAPVVERVKQADTAPLAKEIIVVDDGSKDGTSEVIRSISGIRALVLPKNLGKGGAVKAGFAAATGEIVLIQDADLEYDPGDYKAIVAPILAGRVEAVMGSRFAFREPRYFIGEDRSPFFSHYIGNKAIIRLTNLLYGRRATDYEGCYKAFTKRLISSIPIEANGFEYDNELICKIFRLGHEIEEVPIRYEPRSYEDGKKIRWTDGMKMLWTIIKWRVLPF